MQIIMPDKKEVFEHLRTQTGCTWLSGSGSRCCCHSKSQMRYCFDDTVKRLTKTILTDAEILEGRAQNEKAMNDLHISLEKLIKGE